MNNNKLDYEEREIKTEDLKDEAGNYLGTIYTSKSETTRKINKTYITEDGDVCMVIE